MFAALVAAAEATRAAEVTDTEVLAITQKHCVPCHASEPQHPAFSEPPRGIVLETVGQLQQHAGKMREQAVETQAMPLGNQTEMTDGERETLGRWIASLR